MANPYTSNFCFRYPEGADLVVQCLNEAVSNADRTCEKAAALLRDMESVAGFCGILLDIYRNNCTSSMQTSFLAITLCKNVIARHWQGRVPPAMEQEEKQFVKEQLLEIIRGTSVLAHMQQLSAVFKKICRTEFPQNWPGLIECVIYNLRGMDYNQLQFQMEEGHVFPQQFNMLILLKDILKEQSSKRLPKDKALSFALGHQLLHWIGPMWNQFLALMICQQQCLKRFKLWEVSKDLDKIVLYLVTYYVEKIEDETLAMDITNECVKKHQLLLQLAISENYYEEAVGFSRNLKAMLKLWPTLIEHQPFVLLCPSISEIFGATMNFLKFGSENESIPLCCVERAVALLRSSFQMHSFHRILMEEDTSSEEAKKGKIMSSHCHEKFEAFLKGVNGVAGFGEVILSVGQMDRKQIEEWMENKGIEVAELNRKEETRKLTQIVLEELIQEPHGEMVSSYVMRSLNEALQNYASSESLKGEVDGCTSMDWCARCDSLFFWAILILKTIAAGDAMFSQLLQGASHLIGSNAHPLLQYRCINFIKKGLNYGTIPVFEAPQVFRLLHTLLKSPYIFVRFSVIQPLKLLHSKFHDDALWMNAEAIDDVAHALVDLLFQLSELESVNSCLEMIRLLLPCAPAETAAMDRFSHHSWQMRKLWDLGHSRIRDELVNIIGIMLSHLEPKDGVSLGNPNSCIWALDFAGDILGDFLTNFQQLSLSTDEAEVEFFRKMLSMWICILRKIPLERIDCAKLNQMQETFTALISFCFSSMESLNPDIELRIIEVVIEYSTLFITFKRECLQNEFSQAGQEPKAYGMICECLTQLYPLVKIGTSKTQNHWIGRRCLHLLLYLISFGFASLPPEMQTDDLQPLLRRYTDLSELRRRDNTRSSYESLELIRYTPEYFIPPLCCWIIKFPVQFNQIQNRFSTHERMEWTKKSLLCFFDSFKKIQDPFVRSAILQCEVTILAACPFDADVANYAIPTVLLQFHTILESISKDDPSWHNLESTDAFFNAFRGSTYRGFKVPAASRFYNAFKLALLHPEATLRNDGISMIKANTEMALRSFMNYVGELLSVLSKMEADQVKSLLEAAPETVRTILALKH